MEIPDVFDGYVYNGQADSTTLNQITTQLIDDGVDVIVPIATPAAQIVQAATEDNQIPVVFSAVSDPVGQDLQSPWMRRGQILPVRAMH